MSELSAVGNSLGLLDRLFPADALAGAVQIVDSSLQTATSGPALISGLRGGSSSFLLAAWYRKARRKALVVAPDREAALQLADDLESWLGRDTVVYLPQQEVLAFDRKSPDPEVVGAFLAGLDRLAGSTPCLAVTSLYGARQHVIGPSRLSASIIKLQRGQRIELDSLCLQLAARGYRPAGMVAHPGDYARRGGLLDVYAPGGEPLRVEFFADEIVSLRAIDVEIQRSCARFDTAAHSLA